MPKSSDALFEGVMEMRDNNSARFSRRLRAILVGAIPMFAVTLGFNNCAKVDLSKVDSVNQEARPFIPQNKTTLAVRGGACLMCHAQIEGDLVTDFGFGQSMFLTQRKYQISGNGDWNNVAISGNIIVPKLIATRDGNGTAITPAKSLKDMLTPEVSFSADPDLSVKGVRGAIVEREGIFIGAPTEDVIKNLTLRTDATLVLQDWDVSIYKIGDRSAINGLNVKQSITGDNYFTNSPGGIQCTGDIILLGVVALNEANIITDSVDGCRLYVQKSVFIKGPVTYNGSKGGYPNLQISSARAVIMGIKGLKTRLEDTSAGFAGIRQATGLDAEKTFNQKLYDDRDVVISELEDAGPWKACLGTSGRYIGSFDVATPDERWEYLDNKLHQPATYDCSGNDWTLKVDASGVLKRFTTRSVNYQGLYINAPKVHSRYLGVFKGVVVAEDAIFALGEFIFKHDDTFSNVPVLPLMQGRLLRVPDN